MCEGGYNDSAGFVPLDVRDDRMYQSSEFPLLLTVRQTIAPLTADPPHNNLKGDRSLMATGPVTVAVELSPLYPGYHAQESSTELSCTSFLQTVCLRQSCHPSGRMEWAG